MFTTCEVLILMSLMCPQRTVGTWGLTGLDRLLCFMIVQELQNFTSFLERRVLKDKTSVDLFNKLSAELEPVTSLISMCCAVLSNSV